MIRSPSLIPARPAAPFGFTELITLKYIKNNLNENYIIYFLLFAHYVITISYLFKKTFLIQFLKWMVSWNPSGSIEVL